MGHLNRGVDGVLEIVRVVGRGLVSVAEVHAIVARAHRAQGEPKLARDRFGFLEASWFCEIDFGQHAQGGGYRFIWRIRFLVALPPVPDLLLFAKHLFVAAIAWQRCDLRRRCGSKNLSAEAKNSPKKKGPGRLELGSEPGRGLSLQSGSNIGLVRSAWGRDVGGGESHFLCPTSSGRYRLVAVTPCRGFVRVRQRFVR
jgi:hypothetical protein